ncbi:hypothetical protein [Streptomyces sp. CRN 30]|uniref:hypothetical protein n=1 Tax=Streptomyces sp. CRN 30 TaxID=3075613 RepID=UPI002A7F8958|nr:hypothetical protein [Streptomyces sp. CRN 30]
MPEILRVDTDGLERVAAVMEPLAEKLRVLAEGVGRQLNALGDPAGNDSFGQQFKGKHDPSALLVLDGTTGVGKALTEAQTGLRKTAAAFTTAELEATRSTSRLGTTIGEGGNSGGGGRR